MTDLFESIDVKLPAWQFFSEELKFTKTINQLI